MWLILKNHNIRVPTSYGKPGKSLKTVGTNVPCIQIWSSERNSLWNSSVLGKVYGYNSDGSDTDKGYKENNFEFHVISICMPFSQCSLHTITTITQNMYLCNWLHSWICLIHIADAKSFWNKMWVLCLRKKFHAWKNHGIWKKTTNNHGKIKEFCEIIWWNNQLPEN